MECTESEVSDYFLIRAKLDHGQTFYSLNPISQFCLQFLQRQQVLSLYRDVQRALRRVPDEKDREELRLWAREEFKRNKGQKEEVFIKMKMSIRK